MRIIPIWPALTIFCILLVSSCKRSSEEVLKSNLLNEICQSYTKMARCGEIQDNFRVLIDVETSEYLLDTIKPLSRNERGILSEMTKLELNQMVSNDTISRMDLTKDVMILDTMNFFINSDNFEIEEKRFRLELNNLDCPDEVFCMVLQNHRLLKNKADFYFLTSNGDLSLTFSFDISNEMKITSSRMKIKKTDRPTHLQ